METNRQSFNFANSSRVTLSAALKPVKFEAPDGAVIDKSEPQITLKGYPICWNVLSSDRGGYKVRLAPGSAKFTTPCLALYGHDFNKPLGNTANGSLRILPADDYGIPVEIDLPDTTSGNDCAEEVEDGYTRGMSFSMANGFEEATDSVEVIDGVETKVKTVTKFTVDEVTVTIVPAFVETTIEIKADTNLSKVDDTEDDDEEFKNKSNQLKELNSQRLKWTLSRLYLFGL